MKIGEMEKWDRPRERAKRLGLSKLEDKELLAILIGSGTKSRNALEIADDLLHGFHSFRNMVGLDPSSFQKYHGISDVKALIFATVFEIQRRVLLSSAEERYESPEKIFQLYSRRVMNLGGEYMFIIYYNRAGGFIKESIIDGGLDDTVSVSVKRIIRESLSLNAKKIVMVHNHTSGNVMPSTVDVAMTELLDGKLMEFNISLIDHIIVTEKAYYSLRKGESGPKIFL